MGHRSVHWRVTAVLCALLCLTTTGCDAIAGRARSFEPVRDPVIAVLGQSPPRVILLDAESLEARGTVRLRSQSIGMAVSGDTIITAQCGDVGDGSDTRVGFLRPRDGRLDYLDLGVLDPEEVWASSSGWCVALNGLVDAKGMRCERIDVKAGTFETLALPPAGQAGTGTRDNVWILRKGVSGEDDRASEEFYIFAEAGEPRVIASATTATIDLCGFEDAVVTVENLGDDVRLVRRNAADGEVLIERRLAGLTAGPGCAWSAGDVLVVANHEYGEGRAVRELVVVDPVSLQEKYRIPVDGVGCVGPGASGHFVVCEADGDVLAYRASDGAMRVGTRIEGRDEELLEVVYLGGTGDQK